MARLNVIRIGSSGSDVKKWQYFLKGQELYEGKVDGIFGPVTHDSTIAFQLLSKLQPDGVVGNKSYGAAMILGFDVAVDTLIGKYGANWPGKPQFKCLVSDSEKRHLFGSFSYVHSPLPKDTEHIRITDGWDKKNIIGIDVPQISRIAGIGKTYFHKAAAAQLQDLWRDWEAADLLHLVITWHGSYNPRFIRGSRTHLSQHAFGTAFDINLAWNRLGSLPAFVGQKGSVRELVQIANENGFYWGGHFNRLDGMHFEIAKLMS